MGHQFFLPMVLRWRTSCAEAPLLKCSAAEKYFSYCCTGVEFIEKLFNEDFYLDPDFRDRNDCCHRTETAPQMSIEEIVV